ncbi:hypothetical protein MTO96_050352, partial [Rhipicephalus appendiculatus]
ELQEHFRSYLQGRRSLGSRTARDREKRQLETEALLAKAQQEKTDAQNELESLKEEHKNRRTSETFSNCLMVASSVASVGAVGFVGAGMAIAAKVASGSATALTICGLTAKFLKTKTKEPRKVE